MCMGANNYPDLNGRNILLTGGTGSFGQQFTQTVLEHFKPERLVIFSRDEYKQFQMQQRFSLSDHPCMRYFIGDVRDLERMRMALRGIDTVVHAAAMKHVPAAEYNPFECIRTNVIGAENVATAAMECGVERVVALSTDKAANPVNLYGASKLASDKIMVAANILSGGKTKYGVVRYGNVLGSRGSVIPFFRRILADGADHIPITDPRMTRFFISLQQGVDFVMTAINGLQGGEIVVPKVPSVRITDLATALAPQLEQRVVGIRPGEKIHETLVSIDDGRATVELDGYFVIKPSFFELQSDFYKEKNAKPVGDDFYYASDNNAFWLKVNEIEDLINELGL